MTRSIFFLSRFHLKVIKFFSVNPRAYQSPYLAPIVGIYKHSAIPELFLNTKCQDVLVRYTQGYNGQGSDAPELMLNININMEGSRDYSQHIQLSFHVFQSFSLNKNVSTHVLQSFLLNTNYQSLMCLELLAQQESSITHVLQSFPLNTKHLINHVLQGPLLTHKIIHKTYVTRLCPIYKTNHHVHMQWGPRPNIPK